MAEHFSDHYEGSDLFHCVGRVKRRRKHAEPEAAAAWRQWRSLYGLPKWSSRRRVREARSSFRGGCAGSMTELGPPDGQSGSFTAGPRAYRPWGDSSRHYVRWSSLLAWADRYRTRSTCAVRSRRHAPLVAASRQHEWRWGEARALGGAGRSGKAQRCSEPMLLLAMPGRFFNMISQGFQGPIRSNRICARATADRPAVWGWGKVVPAAVGRSRPSERPVHQPLPLVWVWAGRTRAYAWPCAV